jgi:hypothetical protein
MATPDDYENKRVLNLRQTYARLNQSYEDKVVRLVALISSPAFPRDASQGRL